MASFIEGVFRFQRDVFPQKKDLFEALSKGQSPEALFITCADSRIEVAMLTQSNPGDLFICRNAGNIVPPHTTHTGGMTASIEFAVSVLKVPHIVVCGHTDCGAMKGALNMSALDSLPHVKTWLGYSRAALEVVNHLAPDADEKTRLQLLLEQNVILQLQHLKTHPSVAAALAKGAVELHGWIYDIKSGDVHAYDRVEKKFVPIAKRYEGSAADEAAPAAVASGGGK